ncbi:MAG: hypothetical protein WCS70_07150 [Verrucomicrobiota bacterium]
MGAIRIGVVVGLLGGVAASWAGSTELFTSLPESVRHAHLRYEKKPTYLECGADGVTIWPGETKIAFDQLNRPDHDLRPLFDELEADGEKRCLVVIQRPGSARTFGALHRALALRRIEVGLELVDAATPVLEAVKAPGFVAGAMLRPVDQRPVYFECRSNTVFYVAKDEICGKVTAFIQPYRPLSKRDDVDLMERRLREVTFGSEFYTIDGPAFLLGKVLLQLRPGVTGEGAQKIAESASQFQTRLAPLAPRWQYVQFLVRDDSVEVLRAARAEAEKRKLEWRFYLLDGDQPLTFGQ